MADSDIEKIKDRLSINEVVGQYVQLQRAGRNYRARCPFHKERTPSFMISPERGSYMCFGCGEKGDIFSFVQRLEGIDFPTALKQLAEKAGVELSRQPVAKSENKEKEEVLRDICEAATQFFQAQLQGKSDALEYLKARGVTEETITGWRLGYVPATWRAVSEHLVSVGFAKDDIAAAGLAAKSERKPDEIYDRFRGRIMFPIFDATGRVIAFSGRFFEKTEGQKGDEEPAKYVNSPETPLFKKSKVLYGFDRAKNAMRKIDCVLLVEGQFDLILAHQSGLPFTVALSGTALTQEHLALLGRLSKRLVLALDADAAGIRAGLKSAVMALAMGFDVKVPTFPPGKDPADVAKENPELLKAAIRTSQTAIEFFLNILWPTARDERSYKKIVEAQVLPLVAALQSSIDQEHFIRIVAERLRVPDAAVRAEVAKKPVLALEESQEEEVSGEEVSVPLSGFEKKVGMLLAHFTPDSPMRGKLEALLGAEKLKDIEERTAPHAEALRFMFESEVGEYANEETIAQDMYELVAKAVEKERFKMKFL